MKYILRINDDENREMGDENTLADTTDIVTQLLQSGGYEVEMVREF